MGVRTKKGKLRWRNKRANRGRKPAKSLDKGRLCRSNK